MSSQLSMLDTMSNVNNSLSLLFGKFLELYGFNFETNTQIIIQTQQELLLKEPNSKVIEQSEKINQTLKETKRMTKLIKEL